MLGVATFAIAYHLSNGSKNTAIAVTLVALSLPIVEFQALSDYVDLFGTAFLMASVALFLYGCKRASADSSLCSATLLLLSALACGVSVGTKPVFYAYAAVYCTIVAVMLTREGSRREAARALGLIAAGILLPSIFWFGRSLAATKNPLFPMQVKVGGRVLLQGFAPSQITTDAIRDKFARRRAEWAIYPWTEWMHNPGHLIPYTVGSGTGAAFAAFVPLGVLYTIYLALTGRVGGSTGVLLLAWLGLAVVWWFSMQRMPRFGLPLLVLACILSGPLLGLLQEFQPRAFRALLLVCVAITCALSALVPLRELGTRMKYHTWKRAQVYAYPHLVDTLPPGTTLLNNTGIHEANFALAGEQLSSHVILDFEVPNPITSQFLTEHRVDYVVELETEGPNASGTNPLAGFVHDGHGLITATAGKENWEFWKVRADEAPHSGLYGRDK